MPIGGRAPHQFSACLFDSMDPAVQAALRDRESLKTRVNAVRFATAAVAALVGLTIAIELATLNVVGAVFSAIILFIPYCGYMGIKKKNRTYVSAFTVANSFCGCCYVVLAVLFALFLIPAIVRLRSIDSQLQFNTRAVTDLHV